MIEAVIDLMVAETNQAFEASGADLQVALSVRSEVPYEEVDAATDLSRLGDPSDGYLDEVHVVRDLVGAEPRSSRRRRGGLRRGRDRGYPGRLRPDPLSSGWRHAPPTSSVTTWDCINDRYDTCRVECTSWPYRFAYGYVNRRAFGPLPSSPAQWRTLMASDAQCREQRSPR